MSIPRAFFAVVLAVYLLTGSGRMYLGDAWSVVRTAESVLARGELAIEFDPGFGGHAPLVPVPLSDDLAQDGDDMHHMVRRGDEWVLEARIDGAPVPLWTSTLAPAEPVDFVMANHFVSTFPQSPFVTNLMLRAITRGERVSVMNENVTRRRDGIEEKRPLASRAELRALLIDDFGFDLPEVERLRVPSVPGWN